MRRLPEGRLLRIATTLQLASKPLCFHLSLVVRCPVLSCIVLSVLSCPDLT